MNVSQEIRNTLTRSGDRMSVEEITDAIGGLADKSFVRAICIQQMKKGVFGRAMEDGRLVYWKITGAPAPAEPAVEEKGAEAIPVAQSAAPEAPVAKAKPAVLPASHLNAPPSPSTTEQLNSLVSELRLERIQRMERTSHNLSRLLSSLLGDAIDAKLDHEMLSRLSSAQLAVQDVHGFLANGA